MTETADETPPTAARDEATPQVDAPLAKGEQEAATATQTRPAAPPRWRLPFLLVVLAVLATTGGVTWYRRSLEQSPARCFARALAALDVEDWPVVEREYIVIERDAKFAPHAHFLRGAMLMKIGRPLDALGEFENSKDHQELKVRTLTLAGQTLYQMGDLRSAQQVLAQVVEVDREAIDAYRWLGIMYYDIGAMEQAVSALTRVSELAPQDPRPLRLLGLMNKDYERYDLAVEHYREALRRLDAGPSGAPATAIGKPPPLVLPLTFREEIVLELAASQIKLRQYEEALQTLREAEDSAEQQVLRSECLIALGHGEQAREALAKALKSDAQHVVALTRLGEMQLEAGQAEAAAESLGRAVEAAPKDYVARLKFAQALRKLGRDAEAEKQGQAADRLKTLRDDFTALHQRAITEPGNPEIRFQLGLKALELDRPDLAQSWFKATLSLDPNHAEARKKLSP